MNWKVEKIKDRETLSKAMKIREEVFVKEQKVAPEEEYDAFENIASHFIVYDGKKEIGTARWRHTEKGIKLERFAVIKVYRGKGVGSLLVKAVLEDIFSHSANTKKTIYLHGQVTAMGLYEKFGFEKIGSLFVECGIDHFLMQFDSKKQIK
jgi:predicted GNAT family N-acyltransferase